MDQLFSERICQRVQKNKVQGQMIKVLQFTTTHLKPRLDYCKEWISDLLTYSNSRVILHNVEMVERQHRLGNLFQKISVSINVFQLIKVFAIQLSTETHKITSSVLCGQVSAKLLSMGLTQFTKDKTSTQLTS